MVVRASRRRWVWMALGSGLAAFVLVGNVIDGRYGTFALVVGLLAVAGCFWSGRIAITRPVAFTIDERGIVVGSGKRFVPWSQIQEIRVAHHQGSYGEEHNLILKLKPGVTGLPRRFITTNATNPDEVELGLGGVSSTWQEVVQGVESASGLSVIAHREGPVRLRSHPVDHA